MKIKKIDYFEKNNNLININDYIKNINHLSFYAGELEIVCITQLLKINIYVFELNKNKEYRFLYKHIYDKNILTYTIILNHTYTKNKCRAL